MKPLSSAEHTLGRIERGEIRAGRQAAREIAARHEAAYGDVWPADHAWAQALNTLAQKDGAA
jgi:hypothetical protein